VPKQSEAEGFPRLLPLPKPTPYSPPTTTLVDLPIAVVVLPIADLELNRASILARRAELIDLAVAVVVAPVAELCSAPVAVETVTIVDAPVTVVVAPVAKLLMSVAAPRGRIAGIAIVVVVAIFLALIGRIRAVIAPVSNPIGVAVRLRVPYERAIIDIVRGTVPVQVELADWLGAQVRVVRAPVTGIT
jgi:hypothetical protein